ncbi:hypothetical protein [Candidatus Colwellia aromaticivorans]|uniref:hypothetical protein n=1 Tax=Candidatus Colwellia aromaticivorans TaxID=2267621 RepID=UPI0014444C7F|nr:hypothetical protein [Candidatus Colwellia aromaticivorans]
MIHTDETIGIIAWSWVEILKVVDNFDLKQKCTGIIYSSMFVVLLYPGKLKYF